MDNDLRVKWTEEASGSLWPDLSQIKALPLEPVPAPDLATKCVRCHRDAAGERCGHCGAIQARYTAPERTR